VQCKVLLKCVHFLAFHTSLRSKRPFLMEGGASPPLRQGSSVIVLLNANWYQYSSRSI
jgi:hypothetical protein